MVTDREMLVATMDAIGALAERITGETLVISVVDDEGCEHRMNLAGGRPEWKNPKKADPPERKRNLSVCILDNTPGNDVILWSHGYGSDGRRHGVSNRAFRSDGTMDEIVVALRLALKEAEVESQLK